MEARGRRGHLPRAGAARLALPILIAVAAAVAAIQMASAQGTRREARMRTHAAEAVAVIQRRLSAYADVLYGVRGLYEASRHVSAAEFREDLRALDAAHRFPALRAIGVAQLRRGRHQLVVKHVEPEVPNRLAVGVDFLAEAERSRGAREALDTGRPTATATVRLRRDNEPGLLIFLPIYSRSLSGAAYTGFRIADAMHGIPDGQPADVAVYDLGPDPSGRVHPPSAANRTYSTGSTPEHPPHGSLTMRFAVLGREWALRYAPREPVLSAAERAAPWLVLAAGGTLAALAAWLLSASVRTERRATALAHRMTADLRAKEAELQRSNEELQRFAYVASHDLREPLRSVTGFIGLLQRRHGERLDEDARTWIGHALAGAQRMNTLIADLLEYSRAGRSSNGRPARADLQAAWDQAVGNLAAAIAESGATVSAGPLPVVAADQREMNQVMQNLLANAIKYRRDEPPVVRAQAEARAGGWAVSVSDNGVGIDPRHQERIFVLFQRLHADDDYPGTGMGLSIVKKIVEARGGSIGVESAPGRGSRFTLVLPAAPEGHR